VKLKIIIGLIFLFSYSTSIGQFMGKIAADKFIFRVTTNKNYGQPGDEIVGSPYLVDEFIKGSVYIDKGNYAGIPLRYNIYDDKIEFVQNEGTYILEPDLRIKKIAFGNYTIVAEKFEYKWKVIDGYLVRLDSGKMTLLAKKVVTFKERQETRAMESSPTPAKFSNLGDVFYFKIGNNEPKKIDSMKEMIASLPDKQEEMNQFVKKEKISPKKEDELLKLVRYYNSL
jgi:hypothetical protein